MRKQNGCPICGEKLSGGYCSFCGYNYNRKSLIKSNTAEPVNRKESYKMVQPKQVEKVQRSTRTPRWIVAVLIVMIFVIIVPVVLTMALSNVGSDLKESFYEESEYEYDPYVNVKYEIPETGETFDVELISGEYEIGVQLPEGVYNIQLLSGSGNMNLSDYLNGIFDWKSFEKGAEDDYSVTEWTDVKLYQGGYLSISGDIILQFSTKNGQMDKIEVMDNPITEIVTIQSEEKQIAGKDFPAGVYDVCMKDGYTVFEYSVPADDEYYENGMMEDSLWLDGEEKEDVYCNLTLPEGTEVYAEAFSGTLLLKPSAKIGTTDYAKRYFNE